MCSTCLRTLLARQFRSFSPSRIKDIAARVADFLVDQVGFMPGDTTAFIHIDPKVILQAFTETDVVAESNHPYFLVVFGDFK